MKVICTHQALSKVKADVLILGGREDDSVWPFVDREEIGGGFATSVARKDFAGKTGQSLLLFAATEAATQRVLLIGLGEASGREAIRKALGGAVNLLRTQGYRRVAVALETLSDDGIETAAVAQLVVETVVLAYYRFDAFNKEKAAAPAAPRELVLVAPNASTENAARVAGGRGRIVAESTNFARDLQNQPGNLLTPKKLAGVARSLAKRGNLKIKVLGEPEMQGLKMGALLGVAKGSAEPARFIVLEHNREAKSKGTTVLVGKGITFDTGGISLKPSDKMEEMKFDMSGAAAVLGTLKAVAELQLPKHVVGLIPTAENMPGSAAVRPGDILTASDGTTIEVGNTDAEGRLVLADALVYARRFKPQAVIDLATLTGAVVLALGHHRTGLMANAPDLAGALKSAGDRAGEKLWQLPLTQEYYDDIKGDYADIKNSAGRPGSVITAAAFLGTFARDFDWAHLDIAGTAWTNSNKDCFEKGGTGVGVRLLVEFLSGQSVSL